VRKNSFNALRLTSTSGRPWLAIVLLRAGVRVATKIFTTGHLLTQVADAFRVALFDRFGGGVAEPKSLMP